MTEHVSREHPTVNLLFAIEGEATQQERDAMRDAIGHLATTRHWTITPPAFVDEEEEATAPGDTPIVTVGGVLEVYSSFPPWDEDLPLDIDRAHYNEVRAVLDAMCDLSRTHGLCIGVEYNGERIGSVEAGSVSRSLATGLLQAWERSLLERA
ncbi:MAG: hypothetical protein H6708_11360 [Kofleriaceae bacterium]|nr:hypothetical protein [Myxococcales bacterium]MCB9560995.1 hypothetical protein [Kofleriaceae bacterium]